ncbi:putative non-specific serine/threonine protein kinase [Helianthus annuus]|nr:putative non-specific serine/threonine protein kinase [Helianthus annuus]
MARLICIILSTFLLPFSVLSQQIDRNVRVCASLIATDDVKPWALSPSGDFAFGFKQMMGKDDFMLSIWYDKIPDKTIIWYPKTTVPNPMVSRGSKVELIDGRGLVLTDPQGTVVWTSLGSSDIANGVMKDTGNFVIVENSLNKIWDSFDSLAHTLLPTQIMKKGGGLMSTMSETNYSDGRFQLRLLHDGNLVLSNVDMFSRDPLHAYYIGVTFDPSNATNSGDQLIFDATGYMYILRGNGKRFDLTLRDKLPIGDYYHRATLDSDGVFTQYYHPKNSTDNTKWEAIQFIPENICNRLSETIGSGACGLNNVCSLVDNRPKCECPPGFSFLDSNDPNEDCIPDFTPICDKGYWGDLFDFTELTDIDWPGSDYANINPTTEEKCKRSFLEDCFCVVATYKDRQCWKKTLPLFNGMKNSSLNMKAFLKFRKGDGPLQSPHGFSEANKNQRSLISVGPVLLSAYVFVIFVLVGVICVSFFLLYKKKAKNPYPSSKAVDDNLPHFTYQQLVKATNGFKVELGKGAFGIVYKGVVGTNMVAVKKLDRVLQDGEKEFQTEQWRT